MTKRPRDAEKTKTVIIEATRRLFAERDIASVSIRDIATAAGVSHGLVQQYFGTREEMIAGIIKREIDTVMSAQPRPQDQETDADLEQIRTMLKVGMERFRDFALLITRAQLAGIEPEKMLDPNVPTPAMHLATAIANQQAKYGTHNGPKLDPKIVSIYVNAALFGFSAMAPWLMATVGQAPEDFEKRSNEFVDITLALIALACGDEPR